MASNAKYAKYNSVFDDIISIIRTSYLGKPVDEEFLSDLKFLMENKMVATGVERTDIFFLNHAYFLSIRWFQNLILKTNADR